MTIREIAKQLGVSPATVSNVLNGKGGVGDATRQRVQDALEKFGYEINNSKKNAQNKLVLVVKYVVDGFLVEENQGFISMIIDSISEQLRRDGFAMSMTTAKGEISDTLDRLVYDSLAGVIVVASELPRSMYGDLKEIPVPLVVVDNMMPGYSYCCVGINNAENVLLALSYCKKCGFRTIGYLKSAVPAENFEARSQAYEHYADELGLTRKSVIPLTPTLMGAFDDMTNAIRKNRKLTRDLPECFFADNDTIALGAMRALRKAQIRTPEDVRVIGFDDIPYSAVNAPTLTTVRVQRDLIGQETVRRLLIQIENPEYHAAKTDFVGELIVRTSMRDRDSKQKASV